MKKKLWCVMIPKGKLLVFALVVMMLLVACGSTATPSVQDGGSVRGRINGNTYTNDFFQLSLTLPRAWQFQDDASIAEMRGLDRKRYNFDENGASLIDMVAIQNVTYANIAIQIDDTSQFPDGIAISYLEIMEAKQRDLASHGVEITIRDTEEITIRGNTYQLFHTYNYTRAWAHQIEQHFLLRRQGNYLISIVIATPIDDSIISFGRIITYFH